jgi:hypothetical protein
MAVLKWLFRCTPGLSVFCLLILLEAALRILETEWLSFFRPPFLTHIASPVVAQTVFVTYAVFLHLLAFFFPLRLCACAYAATQEIKAAHERSNLGASPRLKAIEYEFGQIGQQKPSNVTMAIILPSYKEDIEILESSMRVLASHSMARNCYDVYCLRKPKYRHI